MKTKLYYCSGCGTPFAMSGDVTKELSPCCNKHYEDDYDTIYARQAELELSVRNQQELEVDKEIKPKKGYFV